MLIVPSFAPLQVMFVDETIALRMEVWVIISALLRIIKHPGKAASRI